MLFMSLEKASLPPSGLLMAGLSLPLVLNQLTKRLKKSAFEPW